MSHDFWLLRPPSNTSDYQHAYVNGGVEYAHRLPATGCRDCARPIRSFSVLPFACPEEFQSERFLSQSVVPPQTFDALRDRLATHLSEEHRAYLQPGAPFEPGLLDIPSKPTADFLWSELEGPMVSERVRRFLVQVCPTEVYFTAVSYRKVGRRSARARPPIPSTGEPEDVIHAVPLLKSSEGLARYSRVNVRHESGWPADAREAPPCAACGRPNHPARHSRPAMTPSMWRGHNFFYLATTLYIVVTNLVRERLEAMELTNVTFEPAAA